MLLIWFEFIYFLFFSSFIYLKIAGLMWPNICDKLNLFSLYEYFSTLQAFFFSNYLLHKCSLFLLYLLSILMCIKLYLQYILCQIRHQNISLYITQCHQYSLFLNRHQTILEHNWLCLKCKLCLLHYWSMELCIYSLN